jgi:hypothetical protein
MKKITTALIALFVCSGAALAALPVGEEIEFRFEPSFRDGILVWLARTPDGKIHCSAYRLPVVDDCGVESHSRAAPKLLREVPVSAKDFDALVAVLDGEELRAASETDSTGLDGTGWIFRRKAGGRRVELRFWTPERDPTSPALSLGRRFLAVAQIENELTSEEPNQAAQPIPVKAPRG